MTDEETAEEYAECEQCAHCINPQYCKGKEDCYGFDKVKSAFLAGLKAGRPKWHKVFDGDLPKKVDDYVTNIGVLTYDHYGNGVYKWHTPFCEACDYGDEVDDNEVIEWCEMPKNTEE